MKLLKVEVIGYKGHRQGGLMFPPGAELEITPSLLQSMPDRFRVIRGKVKPVKIESVKIPEKPVEIIKTAAAEKPKPVEKPKEESPVEADDSPAEKKEKDSEKYPFLIGGSWYRLSDKSKVQGRSKAIAAEKLLHDGN